MMKNKIKIIPFLILLFTITASGQSKINSEINEYLKMYQEKDFTNIDRYFFPEMWDYYDKEEVVNQLKESFSNKAEVNIILKKPEILKISDNISFNNKFYAKVFYTNNLSFVFKDKSKSISDLILALESAYGKGNVYYNEDERSFLAIVTKIIIARSDNGINNWKFLTFYGSNEINAMLLPKQVLNKLL